MNNNTTQLLISVSDPLLFYVRMRNWKNRLRPLFDNMIVAISPGPNDQNVPIEHKNAIQEFFTDITKSDPSVVLEFLRTHMNNHGVNIRHLTEKYWDSINDNVLLMEDDDFILNQDLLATYLSRLKNNEVDAIGATRGCTNNTKLMEFCRNVLVEDNVIENICDHSQTHFTPTHFLFRKNVFDKSAPMEAYDHQVGETLNYRGRTFVYDEHTSMDTFVEASLGIFNRVNKVYEHRDFMPGTYGDYDEFSYYYSLTYHGCNFKMPPQSLEWALRQYHYHIGSATCMCRFAFHQPDLLEESMFEEMLNFQAHPEWGWSDWSILEIYRRFVMYRMFYNLVRNDAAFARFVPAYDANFAIADEFFTKTMRVDELMKKHERSMFDLNVYAETFKHIIGPTSL